MRRSDSVELRTCTAILGLTRRMMRSVTDGHRVSVDGQARYSVKDLVGKQVTPDMLVSQAGP